MESVPHPWYKLLKSATMHFTPTPKIAWISGTVSLKKKYEEWISLETKIDQHYRDCFDKTRVYEMSLVARFELSLEVL